MVEPKGLGIYAGEAIARFTTAMAAKGTLPQDALVSLWTVCCVQLRNSGVSPQDMAEMLICFQRTYTNLNTH